MNRIYRLTLSTLLISALSLALSGLAGAAECEAQGPDGTKISGKTLEGEIKIVNKKRLIVRQYGEQIQFQPQDYTVVSGKKDEFGKLKKGDWVIVCSKLLARPRIPYTIEVIDKPDDGAEDL